MNLIRSLATPFVAISLATGLHVEGADSEPANIAPAVETPFVADLPLFEVAVADTLDWGVGGITPCTVAAQYLASHCITDKETIELAYGRKTFPQKWTESLLRAQLASADLPDADRPRILYALAVLLKTKSAMPVFLAQYSAEQLERFKGVFGEADLEYHLNANVADVANEAKQLFTELSEHHNSEILVGNLTFGDLAKSAFFEMEHLSIGKTAPEIEAEDLDGIKFKLSDYRGKVVLLTFWATWCGPCMEKIPEERNLAERFSDQPFAIVGVNGDPEKGNLSAIVEKQGITWRSFWCGEKGPLGDLPLTWNISSWPTMYLLDEKGVIRAKNLHGDSLVQFVDDLVQRAAKDSETEEFGE